MHSEFIYIILALVILTINIIPAFMPPTWIILAFFYINFHLFLLPTVIIGAIMATTGRIILALFSRKHFVKIFPKNFINNYTDLGFYLKQNNKITIPVVLGYAFLPISSNYMFIMAGLSNLNLKLVSGSFLAGRLFSYSFWVTAAKHITSRLEDLFSGHLANMQYLSFEIIGLIMILIIGKIKWSKILKIKRIYDSS